MQPAAGLLLAAAQVFSADKLFIAGNALTASNMYAYCNGNPVMWVDVSGAKAVKVLKEIGSALINMMSKLLFKDKPKENFQPALIDAPMVALIEVPTTSQGGGAVSVAGVVNAAKEYVYDEISFWTRIILIFTFSTKASVKLIAQKTDKWCWAASALMIAKRYDNSTKKTQEDIVTQILGNDSNGNPKNLGGTSAQAAAAIKYAANNKVEYKYVSTISESTLVANIKAKNPVYLRRYFSSNNTAHAVVVYGYKKVSGTYYFLVRDPGPVGIGSNRTWIYAYMTNGIDGGEIDGALIKK